MGRSAVGSAMGLPTLPCGLSPPQVGLIALVALGSYFAGLISSNRGNGGHLSLSSASLVELALPPAPSDTYHFTFYRAIYPVRHSYAVEYSHSHAQFQCWAQLYGYSFELDQTLYETYEDLYWIVAWQKVSAAIERIEIVLARRAGAAWTGGAAIQSAVHPLSAHEWFFWVDSDLVIQHMDVRMEDFFDPTGPYEMVIADHLVGDFNTGFVGFKATPRALAFLKRVSAAQPKCKAWFVGEQGGFNQVIYEMIQEHLCFDDGHILPASHDACDKELLQKCINACGDMLELFPCYEAFRAKLPPDVWTYGHRTLFPWMLFHKYNGSDPDSPLVSFNRFWQHDPKFHPLSRPSDFISHAKTHQDPYVFLVAQMEKITQTRKMARDGGETFCQAMTRMDTWCNKTHGDKCDRDNVVIS